MITKQEAHDIVTEWTTTRKAIDTAFFEYWISRYVRTHNPIEYVIELCLMWQYVLRHGPIRR